MSDFVYVSREANVKNAPLLILLHGYGSNEADLFSFAPLIPSEYHVVSLRAPLPLGTGYAWFPIHFQENMERWTSPDEVQQAVLYIEKFMAYYTAKTAVDANNVTLFGFSQGAMLSYTTGIPNPKVSGIAALSGYLDSRVVSFKFPAKPIYVSHGKQDMVVPYAWAEQSVDLLNQNGYAPVFNSYDQGHGVNQENLNSVIAWLQAQL